MRKEAARDQTGPSTASSSSKDGDLEFLSQERRREIRNCSETFIRIFYSRQGYSDGAVTYRTSKLWKDKFDLILQENDLVGAILDFLKKTPDLKSRFLDYLSVPESEVEDDSASASK